MLFLISRFSALVALSLLIVIGACAHAATVEKTTYNGLEAYRLSDGQTEAVVVPALSARVMRYGKIGGPNWLWNGATEKKDGVWANWGGDKTFIGPHPLWRLGAKELWPPPTTWDGTLYQVKLLPNGGLKATGPTWPTFGIAITREFCFEPDGTFSIRQTLEKQEGDPLFAAIWSVSQATPPDAVFLPLKTDSAYPNGFGAFGGFPQDKVERVSSQLLQITPAPGNAYKLGTDAPVSALAAVKDGVAWVQRAARPAGIYPEGQDGKAGFPVEFYNHSDAGAGAYVELELLSPMRPFTSGARWTHTVRWSLHSLPSQDVKAPAVREAVEKLLEDGA